MVNINMPMQASEDALFFISIKNISTVNYQKEKEVVRRVRWVVAK